MSWNYAELSKVAKTFGGPEKYVNAIETMARNSGHISGRREMIPFLILGIFATGVAGWFLGRTSEKKNNLDTLTAANKAELVSILEKYEEDEEQKETEKNA